MKWRRARYQSSRSEKLRFRHKTEQAQFCLFRLFALMDIDAKSPGACSEMGTVLKGRMKSHLKSKYQGSDWKVVRVEAMGRYLVGITGCSEPRSPHSRPSILRSFRGDMRARVSPRQRLLRRETSANPASKAHAGNRRDYGEWR